MKMHNKQIKKKKNSNKNATKVYSTPSLTISNCILVHSPHEIDAKLRLNNIYLYICFFLKIIIIITTFFSKKKKYIYICVH